jgi:MarR family transcriptional regulator, 2-MHQ and catechol-resistance regulon repressor
MPSPNDQQLAERMADLTYRLLENCTEKQEYIAEKFALSLSEFRCLRSFQGDKTLCVKDIAQRMNLTSSRLTRIVDGLVAKQHVTREINPIDRRVMDISLTPEGIAISRRLNIDYVSLHHQILETIPPTVRHTVIKALDELALAMSTWMKE